MNEQSTNPLRALRRITTRAGAAPWIALVPALVLLSGSAWAQAAAAAAPAPHQLWVSHVLAGAVAALVAFIASRWWPLAGIVLVAALWYALARAIGTAVPPEAVQQFGSTYPFHLRAAAFFVPFMVLAAMGARYSLRPQRTPRAA